jgi:uncharacterized protein
MAHMQFRTIVVCLSLCLLGTACGQEHHPANIIQEEVQIPLRDGVRLGATLYRPDRPGKFPALVYRTPYGKDHYNPYVGLPYSAAKRGYLVLLVDVRGRYTSEGEFRAYQNEKQDGFDVIEWIGKHPLSTGKVGSYGYSYPGIVQWLALSQNPPSLKAAVPGLTPIDSHHFFYVGGAASFGWMDWFMENILPDLRKRAGDTASGSPDPDRAEADWRKIREQYLGYRPLIDVPVLKKYAPEYYDWLAHPDKSSWWDFASVTKDIPKISAPVIAISGWYDAVYGVVGASEAFRRMTTSAATETARNHTRLILGPWNHTNPTVKKTAFGDINFGPAAGYDAEGDYLTFFDCELKGICNVKQPRVSIFVMGENRWREENEWPLKRAVPTSYYLHSSGRAGESASDGSLSTAPPKQEKPDTYVFDPKNPVVDKNSANSVPYDQREIESRRDVLVYTSAPLEQDVEVTGEVIAELFVRTSARDTDFAITFCDVYPDGRSINLSGLDSGYLRIRYRNGYEKQELATPGAVYKIRIGGLITSNLFKKGHRIRVQVTSSKLPHYDPNPNTGTDIATETKLVPATQTVEHRAEYPSRLILPVIPRN